MQWSVCGEETYEMCSGVCVGRRRMRCAVECVWGGEV